MPSVTSMEATRGWRWLFLVGVHMTTYRDVSPISITYDPKRSSQHNLESSNFQWFTFSSSASRKSEDRKEQKTVTFFWIITLHRFIFNLLKLLLFLKKKFKLLLYKQHTSVLYTNQSSLKILIKFLYQYIVTKNLISWHWYEG